MRVWFETGAVEGDFWLMLVLEEEARLLEMWKDRHLQHGDPAGK